MADLLPDSPSPDPTDSRFSAARAVVLQGVLMLGGLAAFFFLLLEVGQDVNPLLIGVVGMALLWPIRQQPAARALLIAAGLLIAFWLLRTLGGVLAPFVIVWLLAYLLDPVVVWAEGRLKMPRWASTLLLTLLVVGLLVLVSLLFVPNLIAQVELLAQRVIGLLSGLPTYLADNPFVRYLETNGLVDMAELETQLSAFLPDRIAELAGRIPDAVGGLSRSVGTLIEVITVVVLVPVLLFYVLKDYPKLRDTLTDQFPTYQGGRDYLFRSASILGNYLRGQLLISAISAFNVSLFLGLFGVPFAFVIGLLAGVLNMIPNLGAIITNVIAIAITLAFGSLGDVVVVVIVLLGQSLLEQAVLTPNIMSQQVGLHPVLIILSLFVFGALMGFVGLLLAVPATAILLAFYRTWQENRFATTTGTTLPEEVAERADA
ncbi:MAG: AI-2E family transporter [Bacteroidota bacterium]